MLSLFSQSIIKKLFLKVSEFRANETLKSDLGRNDLSFAHEKFIHVCINKAILAKYL